MAQQISIEAAYESAQQKAGELLRENILLKARVTELEGELGQLRSAPATPLPAPGLGATPAEEAPYGNHANFDQQNDLERSHG